MPYCGCFTYRLALKKASRKANSQGLALVRKGRRGSMLFLSIALYAVAPGFATLLLPSHRKPFLTKIPPP